MATELDIDIEITNLYSNGYIVDFPEDGESLLLRKKIVFTGDEKDDWHIVRAGDRLDLLAYKYYNNSIGNSHKLWWAIADANNIHNPFDLSSYVGTEILIPDFQKILLKV